MKNRDLMLVAGAGVLLWLLFGRKGAAAAAGPSSGGSQGLAPFAPPRPSSPALPGTPDVGAPLSMPTVATLPVHFVDAADTFVGQGGTSSGAGAVRE